MIHPLALLPHVAAARNVISNSSGGALVPVKTTATIQISTSSLSLVSSIAMVIMITRTERGLTTPYRRIIFGLSVSDIIQSTSFLIGPFFVPSNFNTDITNIELGVETWGLGNAATCRITGFLMTTGMSALPCYTCFLCVYYLCKLKYKMTNEEFKHKVEIKFHIVIVLYIVTLATIALYLDIYHVRTRSFCNIAYVPYGCKVIPDLVGECDPVSFKRYAYFTIFLAISAVCYFVTTVVCMTMLCYHVITFNRNHMAPQSAAVESAHEENTDPDPGPQRLENSIIQPSEARQRLNQLSAIYRREMMIQACSYTGSFLLIFAPPIIAGLIERNGLYPSPFMQLLPFILFPLGGLFNIMIYLRPQVTSLKRAHPNQSWSLCFWLVLKAGGELPLNQSDSNDPNVNDTALSRRGRNGTLSQQIQELLHGRISDDDDDDDDENNGGIQMIGASFSLPPDFASMDTPPLEFSHILLSSVATSGATSTLPHASQRRPQQQQQQQQQQQESRENTNEQQGSRLLKSSSSNNNSSSGISMAEVNVSSITSHSATRSDRVGEGKDMRRW